MAEVADVTSPDSKAEVGGPSPVAVSWNDRPSTTGGREGDVAGIALDCLRDEAFDSEEVERIQVTRRRVAEDELYVVAIGEFKRGKSTLLNALIRRPILPVGVVPLTSVVTVLRRGNGRAVAFCEDGSRTAVDPLHLTDYVTEAGNPGNRQHLTRVEVSLPDLELPDHVALIDTPGLASVYASGTDHTLGLLPQIDVALVVLSVDQPLTDAEERLATQLRDQGAELLFVMNKTDYLAESEAVEALTFVTDRLDAEGFGKPLVLGVSAKSALRGEPGSGVEGLRRHLVELIDTRYDAIRSAQSLRRVEALLAELETSYAVRTEIASRGERELDDAPQRLKTSRQEVERLTQEQDAIFSHRIQTAEHGLSDDMWALQAELEKLLLGVVDELDAADGEVTESLVDERFFAVLGLRLAEAADAEGRLLQSTLREACERLLSAFGEIARSLAEQTEEILGVPIACPIRSATDVYTPTVAVKLRDDPVGLEMLTGAMQSTLPRRARRRLVVRRSRERAAQLSNRHAGRLRSELASSLREATRIALRTAHDEIDSFSNSIECAIERGLTQRRLAEGDAEKARAGVATALECIRSARAAFRLPQ